MQETKRWEDGTQPFARGDGAAERMVRELASGQRALLEDGSREAPERHPDGRNRHERRHGRR